MPVRERELMKVIFLIFMLLAQHNDVDNDRWMTPVLYKNSDGDVLGIVFQEVSFGFEDRANFGEYDSFFLIGQPDQKALDVGLSNAFDFARLKNFRSLSWIVYCGNSFHNKKAARRAKQFVNGLNNYVDSKSLSLYLCEVRLDEFSYNTLLNLNAKVLIFENVRASVGEKANTTIAWQVYSRDASGESAQQKNIKR